jgi:mxaA protein
LVLALLFPPVLSRAQTIVEIEVIEPRTFGYVVGDTIRREVLLTLQSDYRLDRASLPEGGRLDRWLELADPELRTESGWRGRRYHLILTYRLRSAPPAVETISIPQENLRIVSGRTPDGRLAQTTLIPALRISVAPVTAAGDTHDLTGSSLQDDRAPVPISVEPRQRRLAWTSAALLVLLMLATCRRGVRAFVERRKLPFAMAVRELRRLHSRSGAAASVGASAAPGLAAGGAAQDAARLRIVHEAINRTAGRTIFAHNLDDFLAAHSEYAGLRDDFDRLFVASDHLFFNVGPPPDSAAQGLLRLCQLCRRIERRSSDVRAAEAPPFMKPWSRWWLSRRQRSAWAPPPHVSNATAARPGSSEGSRGAR